MHMPTFLVRLSVLHILIATQALIEGKWSTLTPAHMFVLRFDSAHPARALSVVTFAVDVSAE